VKSTGAMSIAYLPLRRVNNATGLALIISRRIALDRLSMRNRAIRKTAASVFSWIRFAV